jgi:hypothetical protein
VRLQVAHNERLQLSRGLWQEYRALPDVRPDTLFCAGTGAQLKRRALDAKE